MNANHLFHSQVQSDTDGSFGNYKYTLSLKENPGSPDPSLVYFQTEDSSGYEIQGRTGFFLLGSLQKRSSNLDLWTITLMGPSGKAISCDFASYNGAGKIWQNFKSKAWVSIEDLPASYLGD